MSVDSQGIRAGNLLYVSGCIGLDPKTGEFVSQDITGQAEQVHLPQKTLMILPHPNYNQIVD
jgi:enamine deaminase RidA (YjgF/YER057c/UK114 family)